MKLPRHRSEGPSSTTGRGGAVRALLLGTGAILVAVLLSTGGAGTFALWSGNAVAQGVTITSGTTGLTINGTPSAVIEGMDASKLGPGTSVLSVLTLENTGGTPLTIAVTASAVTAQTGALADELTVRLTAVESASACAPGLAGASGRLSTFTTAPSGALAAAASELFCLEIALDLDAPPTSQGATASFTLTFTGAQVAT